MLKENERESRVHGERGCEQIMCSQFGFKVLILNNPTANLYGFACHLANECL